MHDDFLTSEMTAALKQAHAERLIELFLSPALRVRTWFTPKSCTMVKKEMCDTT